MFNALYSDLKVEYNDLERFRVSCVTGDQLAEANWHRDIKRSSGYIPVVSGGAALLEGPVFRIGDCASCKQHLVPN